MTKWFAVTTKPAAEYDALVEMQRVGLTVYLPQFRKEYVHHRTKGLITRQFPLFPGYLFTVADKLDWIAFASCKGFMEHDPILRDPLGKPLPIDGTIIARIRNSEDCGEFDELRSTPSRLQPGETVKMTDGALSGMEGPLSRVRNHYHVRLLVKLFNTEIEASVAIAKIQRAA